MAGGDRARARRRYGRLGAGGWCLVRRGNGDYDLRQVAADRALVSTRSIRTSPFAEDQGAAYFAGYDANKAPAHDTAWVYKSSAATAIGAAPRSLKPHPGTG